MPTTVLLTLLIPNISKAQSFYDALDRAFDLPVSNFFDVTDTTMYRYKENASIGQSYIPAKDNVINKISIVDIPIKKDPLLEIFQSLETGEDDKISPDPPLFFSNEFLYEFVEHVKRNEYEISSTDLHHMADYLSFRENGYSSGDVEFSVSNSLDGYMSVVLKEMIVNSGSTSQGGKQVIKNDGDKEKKGQKGHKRYLDAGLFLHPF